MVSDRREFVRVCATLGVGASPMLLGAMAQMHVQRRVSDGQVSRWREAFPAIHAAGESRVYLDSAATTHRPQPVLDAIATFYVSDNANPAPVHSYARRAADRLLDARKEIARFVNTSDPLEIVFTRGTTEAINLAASAWGGANLVAGDQVLLTVSEHYSNLLPWVAVARRAGAHVAFVDVDDDGHIRLDDLQRKLSPRTRLVAFSHVSNVLGIVNPAKEIVATAHAAGARVFIDGAQGAPHVPVDVQDLQCDFYAFSGHKMTGPMATGVLWARRELLETMPPYHVGSNMSHDVELDGSWRLEHGAMKFQAGTPDVAGPVALAAAVRFLISIGRDELWAHDQALVQRAADRLGEIKGLRLIGSLSAGPRIPVFTFTLSGWKAADVAAALDRRGIAVRAGDMAARPLLKRFGVTEAIRASAYLYNTVNEIDRFADALDAVGGGH